LQAANKISSMMKDDLKEQQSQIVIRHTICAIIDFHLQTACSSFPNQPFNLN